LGEEETAVFKEKPGLLCSNFHEGQVLAFSQKKKRREKIERREKKKEMLREKKKSKHALTKGSRK